MWNVKEIAKNVYDDLCANNEYAKNILCDTDVEKLKELYKELETYPSFKNALTLYDKSMSIGISYLEKSEYDLFDIYLSNTDYNQIQDEGGYNLFCYIPEKINNEKFIEYYNQFVEKFKNQDYSLILKFIDGHIYAERLSEYKKKIFLLLDEIPKGFSNKKINELIYSIFDMLYLMNVSNEEQNKYEEVVLRLLDKTSEQNWSPIIQFYISENVENTALLEKILSNTKYKEYMYNTNNYNEIYEKYNGCRSVINKKYINLLSPDFINLQKNEMINNPSFILKKNTGVTNIFLDCALYSLSENDEKELIKSEIKKALLKNENLFLITKYESSKNKVNNLTAKSRENLLLSFEKFLLFIKQINRNTNRYPMEDMASFADSYMEIFSLNDDEIINKNIVYNKAQEIYPELSVMLKMKEEKRSLKKIIKKDSSLEILSKKRI